MFVGTGVRIEVDEALVSRAAAVLGTTDVDQTVRAALEAAVRRARRREPAARELPAIAATSLAELRSYPVTGEMSASEAIEEDRGGA